MVYKNFNQQDFNIENLPGENKYPTTISKDKCSHERLVSKVLYNNMIFSEPLTASEQVTFERPAPATMLHFNPEETNLGIVTCGGLCPGLNAVIRAITLSGLSTYKVKNVYGFRFGYQGLTSKFHKHTVTLTPSMVDFIHEQGGTILSSSRGSQDIKDMVDTLVKFNISVLFTVGGDGTQKGAMAIYEEIKRRKLDISVIGIPKTIDNDLSFIYRTFGFYTAVEEAVVAINDAHTEAKGADNGIGLVKLMGRHSGAIAAHATLASGNANVCLIPEIPLDLDKLCEKIKKRFEDGKDHVVIVVAEGVGQDVLYQNKKQEFDASGNLKLQDIGLFLKEEIPVRLKKTGVRHNIRYIDPSYMIRAKPANANDSSFCLRLGNNAVHAAMSGKTNCIIGYWNQHFTLTPIKLAVSEKKGVDISSTLWQAVEEITI